jgi:hypothetical protein
MSEPAKDETDLVQCMAKAMHDSVYGGESAWMDVSKIEQSYREMEADAALAAIRAAGWAVVPARLTKDMEYDALRAENARLREALTWYGQGGPSAAAQRWDGGAKARAALEVKP